MHRLFSCALLCILLLAATVDSLAAITVDASSNVVTATKVATSAAWAHPVGVASNRMLIVGVSVVNSGTNYVANVNFGGTPLARIGTRSTTSGGKIYLTELWYLLSPVSGTNVVTVNLATPASIVAGAISLAGVNLNAPLGTFVSTAGNSKNASLAVTTENGDLVVDTLTTTGVGTFATAGAGQTIRWNPPPTGGTGWSRGEGSTKAGAVGSTTMAWTSNRIMPWSCGAVPVHAALSALTVSKSFSAPSVLVNSPVSMTITLTNPNPVFISGIDFNDLYPANLVNAGSAPLSVSCGGTVTMSQGGSSLSLTNGSVPAAGSCSLVVPVTATAAGSFLNSTGTVTTASTLPAAAASATLTAMAPPTASKSFSPAVIPSGSSSELIITLTNPNVAPITGVALVDTYPSTNVKNGAALPTANSCGGTVTMSSGGSVLALSGGTIPAGGSCTVVVPVTGTAVGTYLNSTGSISTANAGIGSAAAATLTVVTAPTATKSFSPGVIPVNGPANLIITLINTNATNITGVAFTDNYPSATMQNRAAVPTLNSCGGTVTMSSGGSSLSLAGGVVPGSSSCSISVPVTVILAGTYTNNSGPIETGNAGTLATAAATLVVMAPPTVLKSFSPGAIPVNVTTNLTLTLINPNATPITGVAITDTYPSTNLRNVAAAPSANSCGGTVTMTSGGSALALSGGIIPASGSCTLVAAVTANVAGSYLNSSGAIDTANAGSGSAAAASLTVMAPPAATKSFSPGTILPNSVTNLTITLTNPNASAIAGVAFTDIYPASMVNTAVSPVSNNCGGTVTMSAGGASLALSGGSIPAAGSCSLVVPVTTSNPGSNLNSSGLIATENAGTGVAALATLLVVAPPVINKTFSPAVILPNGATTLTFDLMNTNATNTTGVGFTDDYPANMKNAVAAPSSNSCGGTVTMINGGSSFSLAGGTIPAAGSCSIVVAVTATTTGTYLNSTGAVSSTNAGIGDADTDTLTVLTSGAALKAFSPATIQQNTGSQLTITLANPNNTDIRNAAFTDNYPFNLVNSANASPSTTCGGTVTAANGGTSLALSGGTIPATGSCVVTVTVTSAVAGSYLNSTGTITSNAGNIAAATATLSVKSPPQIILTQSGDVLVAKPGEEVLYTVYYRNVGATAASNLLLAGTIPAHTTYVAESLRRGTAASTYLLATSLTDAADGDAGQVSGANVIFMIPAVAADDGVALAGADEGKIYYKVLIQ